MTQLLGAYFFSLPVGFADESSAWGHPPDPKVQSKSFKRLQKHLQEHEEDGKLIADDLLSLFSCPLLFDFLL